LFFSDLLRRRKRGRGGDRVERHEIDVGRAAPTRVIEKVVVVVVITIIIIEEEEERL